MVYFTDLAVNAGFIGGYPYKYHKRNKKRPDDKTAVWFMINAHETLIVMVRLSRDGAFIYLFPLKAAAKVKLASLEQGIFSLRNGA